jgi:hypothetical protein
MLQRVHSQSGEVDGVIIGRAISERTPFPIGQSEMHSQGYQNIANKPAPTTLINRVDEIPRHTVGKLKRDESRRRLQALGGNSGRERSSLDEDIDDHTLMMPGPPLKTVVNEMDAGFNVALAGRKKRS